MCDYRQVFGSVDIAIDAGIMGVQPDNGIGRFFQDLPAAAPAGSAPQSTMTGQAASSPRV